MTNFDDWLQTPPDCYTKAWYVCTACDLTFEAEDMERIDEMREEGICCGCWKKGERPEGYDDVDG